MMWTVEKQELETALNNAYEERAMVVIALAHIALRLGLRVWFATDEKEPDWPVLFMELPTGQVSWHFSTDDVRELGAGIPQGANEWDNHTTDEKYTRLLEWAAHPMQHLR